MRETQEEKRLSLKVKEGIPPWKKWGAYVSERSWGTVREDYSENGDAWAYFSHDMARSRAYRWGEDGIAGICDYFQTMAFSFAFWNGKDPILKERLFGLVPDEGNHGEDVKECYYHLDAAPTHSYLKYLYKYPQEAFPYEELIEKNKNRSEKETEFEIQDTDAFNEGKYFDIFIEYAKADIEDICIKIEIWNRGEKDAFFHLIPQLTYRNRWSWGNPSLKRPEIHVESKTPDFVELFADSSNCLHPFRTTFPYDVPSMYLYGTKPSEVLFTHNETHNERVFGDVTKSLSPWVKDAFHRYIIEKEDCVSKDSGTKAGLYYAPLLIEPHKPYVLFFRLSSKKLKTPLKDVPNWIEKRKKEADEFYAKVQHSHLSLEDKAIQRAALAGMIWSQQFYVYEVKTWLKGDPAFPSPPSNRLSVRNAKWSHLYACDVISMPDKWEYPWFAAWDLSFHSYTLSLVDIDGAKEQLMLLLRHWFRNVNGQIPAYEWNFSDLNPPVQAWAFWKVYQQEKKIRGKADRNFLLFGFMKLVENFSWWVNKVDKLGNNFFEGGFLGLDNISIMDRSKPLPGGGVIEQSDATGWMGFYTLWMMRIALELSKEEPLYEAFATNYFEQFIAISRTIHETHDMWDEEDGFFYDIILMPNGKIEKLKIRSFVGIIPFYSLLFLEEEQMELHSFFAERFLKFREYNQEDVDRCVTKIGDKWMFSLMDLSQMKQVLKRVFDPAEFFSDYGLRSISKYHEKNPLQFEDALVSYEPGESLEKIKGGNSNWRGPIWFPTNYLVFDALGSLMETVGEDFIVAEIEGEEKTIYELRESLKGALIAPFRKSPLGFLPVHGESPLYQKDPHFKDLLLFYEHYHGETGRGLGASHQTGWSGLIANIIHHF